MQTSSVVQFIDTLPALATIVSGVKTRRNGRELRAYRPEHDQGKLSTECSAALLDLVRLGHTVRVYVKGSIYTLGLAQDGSLSWERVRASGRIRKSVVIKVIL